MASVVSGLVDPNSPEVESQDWAIGAAMAVSAMSFAEHGYTTVVDGHLFPDGVDGLAAACAARGLSCHYVVLMADLKTCWTRANNRGQGRWTLEFQPFAALQRDSPTSIFLGGASSTQPDLLRSRVMLFCLPSELAASSRRNNLRRRRAPRQKIGVPTARRMPRCQRGLSG